MRKRNVVRLLPILLLISLVGCIKKASGPVTPWEKVTTENAVFAQLLDTATQGTIAAQTSGLLTVAQTRPVLEFYSQTATIQKQLNTILAQAPSATNIPAVQTLVTQVNTAAQSLVGSGALGIKNPKSQQTIGADIQAIVNSVQVILTSYQAATGGK